MTLYRIDDYATTATATDITPAGRFAPDYPYALFCDPVVFGAMTMVADDGTIQKRFTSPDRGASWEDNGLSSSLYGLRLAIGSRYHSVWDGYLA